MNLILKHISKYMLFLKSWLEDYIDLSGIDLNELSNLISIKSSEVEELRIINDYYSSLVVVGKVKDIKQHPEIESLKYFQVEIGPQKSTQIVSKATNINEGMLVVVALPGANFGGFQVASKKLKGIESNGVCLGKSELNLETQYSDGLWDLTSIIDDTNIGKSICEVMPDIFPKDAIIDIKILPDKIAKIGNHMAIAVEIATVLKSFHLLKSFAADITHGPKLVELTHKLDQLNISESTNKTLLVDDTNYVKSFALFDIKLSKKFNLDHDKRKRMFLLGENLTDTIADLSNYIQLDLGQPSHFFKSTSIDSDQLNIKRLDVKTPFNGLGQLKNTVLPEGTIALTDGSENVLAIPGVSGAADSSVTFEDLNVTLELASFAVENVSRNSFLLNYRSSAAKLYCSDVSSYSSLLALLKIKDELEKVEINSSAVLDITSRLNFVSNSNTSFKSFVASLNDPISESISIDYNYINQRLGVKNLLSEIKLALPYVGFVDNDTLRPFPSVNLIDTKEDIVREVARIIGYEQLDDEYINTSSEKLSSDTYYNLIRVKELIATHGYYEIATRPFIHNKKIDLLSIDKTLLKLYNPYRDGVESLRPDLNITLLDTLSLNIKDGHKEPKIFEIGRAYYQEVNRSQSIDIPKSNMVEKSYLGLGTVSHNFNDTTTLINEVLKKFKITEYINSSEIIPIGNKTRYISNNLEVASIIEVSNKIKKQFDLPLNKTIILVNIDLPEEIKDFPAYNQYQDESQFPSIKRSYSIAINSSISTKDVVLAIESIDTDYRIAVDPIERIQSTKIGEGVDKLLLNIRYTSSTRTLTLEDLQPIENKIKTYETKK